ncbi:MAG: murein biosynthesis integral membrane protein MurJ [Candidatus Magasanikbacteria bacterium]|nr:murein biosynthesis integral membrane protein MurJ [Candidatus Magasanikbacteria bacterium]
MLKFLSAESKSVTGAAVVISGATLASRLVGLLRDRALAHYFGAGPVLDAYYAAFKIPDLLYNLLIVGALTAGFIPTFTKLFYAGANKMPAWRLANNVLNLGVLILIILAAIAAIAAPLFVPLLAPGFAESTKNLTIQLTRLMLLSPILFGIAMVMGGVLQSLRRFVIYSLAPVLYNLGIIAGAMLVGEFRLAPVALGWGVVGGASLHALSQIYGAWRVGWRWQGIVNLYDSATRRVGRLMLPRTLGLAMTQFNAVIITFLASLLTSGSVAVYNFANNLQAVATGLIAIPFALAVFPLLSQTAAGGDRAAFGEHLARTIRQILFLTAPATILLLLLRAQIVRVVLGSGQFNWDATIATADALAFFALGLFAQGLIPLLARAFYALANTRTPFLMGLIAEAGSITAAVFLMRRLGVAGLALAGSLGAIINAVLLYAGLRLERGELAEDKLITLLYKITGAGLGMALTVQLLKYLLSYLLNTTRWTGVFWWGLLAGSGGLAVYALLCRILKLEEMIQLQASLKRRWLRLWQVPAGIDEAEQI